MEQLLKINCIPISVEIVIDKPQLNCHSELPKVKISRQEGELKMKADPIKVNIDTFDIRQSVGLKSNDTLIKDFAQEGIKISYQAIARIAKEGDSLADPNGMTPGQIAASKITKSIETIMDFLPKGRPDISWSGGTLNLHYQMDKMDINWDTYSQANFEFMPGKIQFEIRQKPRVDIEYIGGPIYVPPSADPNYSGKEIDLKV